MGNVVTYQVISAGNEGWIYRCQMSGLITTIPHVTLCVPPSFWPEMMLLINEMCPKS